MKYQVQVILTETDGDEQNILEEDEVVGFPADFDDEEDAREVYRKFTQQYKTYIVSRLVWCTVNQLKIEKHEALSLSDLLGELFFTGPTFTDKRGFEEINGDGRDYFLIAEQNKVTGELMQVFPTP